MKLFRFKPSTPGESLLHLLSEELLSANAQIEPGEYGWSNAIGHRGQAIRDYAASVSALNLTARLIKKAERTLQIYDAALHQSAFLTYMQQTLGIVQYSGDRLDEIVRQSLYAAKISKRPVSKATRNKVRQGNLEAECYLCGTMCTHKSADPLASIYYEHIWPASYGGDSIEDNLLPACKPCNDAKLDMLLWQTGAIFSFVLKPQPSTEEQKRIRRREKVARRVQDILSFANEHECSLKNAAISIGPAKFDTLSPIDADDAIDYFNLQFS